MSCASITLAMICPTSSRLCFELWLTKAPCFGEQSRKVFDHQVSDDWWRGLDAHSQMRSGRRVDAPGSIPNVDQPSCGRRKTVFYRLAVQRRSEEHTSELQSLMRI